jgi:DNA topoisomerase III
VGTKVTVSQTKLRSLRNLGTRPARISSAIGHLVEFSLPAEISRNLPIGPEDFPLRPIAKTENRYQLLRRLMERKDVDEIVNACDAGREGELVFRFLIKLAGIKKPLRRLWLQSMTSDAIRSAFGHLRTDSEMIPLAEAAVCRFESDWLVGINAARAMINCLNIVKVREVGLTFLGRLQAPTLAILVDDRARPEEPR